ncbi:MAG TPA: glutamate synthase large subunit [Nitrospiraceae bacterium]|nr:glutamate synthase large subunit [Nitrospiraceae bacterium]
MKRHNAAPVHSGSCGVGFVCDISGKKSRDIVRWGIEAVKNLTHRGAVGADGKTGDGAGILIQIPRKFFLKEAEKAGCKLSSEDSLAVGVFFLYGNIENDIEAVLKISGLKPLCWRDVPVNDYALGASALSTKPRIRHLLLDMPGIDNGKKELRLYIARRAVEKAFGEKVYIPSMSSRDIVYKGMLVAPHLEIFYPDLMSEDFESAFCVFHQRFSTNTFPDWTMAQPLRALAHNGEINTVQGNRNWMATIEHEIRHGIFGDDNELLVPLVSLEESDSSSLDRIVELLMLSGFSPEHAIFMCIPPVWEDSGLNADARAFFEYQSLLMKPWDGPAAVVLTDGEKIVAHLDRNGLRPLRYSLTEDGIFIAGSEAGMIELEGKTIKEKGRLGPGDIISVDITNGALKFTGDIINELSGRKPYKDWIDGFLFGLKEDVALPVPEPEIIRKQIAFGYTSEEIQNSIKYAAASGREMTFSMGDDTPLPPLSEKPQLLFRYFKQRFSQVTNPPIDHIRERTAMSLNMNLGYKRDFLHETPEHAKRLHLDSPVLFEGHIRKIEEQKIFKVKKIDATYSKIHPDNILPDGLMTACVPGEEPPLLSIAVKRLQKKTVEAVSEGAEIIILSDRSISKDRVPIPSLLAVSACFKELQRENLANRASLIIETGEARDVHHTACLIGYGASAVYPYLAFQTFKDMCDKGELKMSYDDAAVNYRKVLEDGLLKVMARMGISTLNSYYGAQLFDSVCLNKDFVDEYFTGTPVVIEADGTTEMEDSVFKRHNAGFEVSEPVLDFGGELRHRKEGQQHAWSTSSVIALNKFIKSMDYNDYKNFSGTANEHPVSIRHLLDYKKGDSISIDEVESEDAILVRFFSGAMSVGALSPEAHETIAEACNRLGMRSNSGEGGEDSKRYGGIKSSAIKQIASGRFGVTPAYLASAREIEIKIAQGAKPGEGGHLPASKVTEYIAMLRHCRPNMLLISPPPHHDIYSIEDLSQLINDLKEANPQAKVCVKLVSETGVGTVAAGVVKAYADIVQISGCDGGTGASPISSIKNAGNYWEIGLSETQRVLIENNLRERIKVRVDGGIKTGRDIIIAALLGAEEFGFGTATMVSAGCVLARQCHLNTCPKGVATQDERLRKKFTGTVEGVMAYFRAVARETREMLAEMGAESIDEIIGRTDLLEAIAPEGHEGAKRIKLHRLLKKYPEEQAVKCVWKCNDNHAPSMNEDIVKDLMPYIEKAEPVEKEYAIRNIHRSIPVRLNYHIAKKYGDEGLPPDTIRISFIGTAGQSFGAFNHKGVALKLIGDANDYVGKGMFGGRIVIRPADVKDTHKNVIAGNTVLYGATGGEFYAAGTAGERFAVRNSGAIAVVEGAGHHLCEYMTRGEVVVLGDAGYNMGAGMTGGVIYILDGDDKLEDKINRSYAMITTIEDAKEMERLKELIGRHYKYTDSPRAGEMTGDFGKWIEYFKKIVPVNESGKSR